MIKKKQLVCFVILSGILIFNIAMAQSPKAFNFQSVARDMSGTLLPNENIGLEFALIQQNPTGKVVYIETHQTKTNANGLYSIEIGRGRAQLGKMTQLDWANGPYFIRIALDETGGQNYRIVGTSELISVPYALYAENVRIGDGKWRDNQLGIDNQNNIGIGTNNSYDKIVVANGNLYVPDLGKGLIMKSPDGNCWKLKLANEEAPGWVAINCAVDPTQVAALTVEPQSLVFNTTENEKAFTIINTGTLPFNWELDFMSEVLSLSQIRGTLSPGSSDSIAVNLDRTKLINGAIKDTIYLTTDIDISEKISISINNFQEEKMLVEGFVIDATYDENNELLITVFEEPNRLDIYNTILKTTQSVELIKPPRCVAVSSDGMHIAVGYEDGFSQFSTTTLNSINYYDTSVNIYDILIPGNGYVYISSSERYEGLRSINLSTGEEKHSNGGKCQKNAVIKLHPSLEYIYCANDGVTPDEFYKHHIREGTMTGMYDSPYHGSFKFDGVIWISEDGTRLFAKSKNTFKSSEIKDIDITYYGRLPGIYKIQTLDHSMESGRIAAVEFTGSYAPPSSKVRLFEDEYMNLIKEIQLPPFLVQNEQYGSIVSESQGYYGHFNSDGTIYYIWVRAADRDLVNQWALVTLTLN